PGASERIVSAAAVLEGGLAEAVVSGALLRILEDVVGLVDRLEPRLGLLAAVLMVGVMLLGQPAISSLDRHLVGAFRDSQQLVIVLLDHHASPLRNPRRRPPARARRCPIMRPYSLRQPRRTRRRPPLLRSPAARPRPTRRSQRRRLRPQHRSRPAGPCTSPRRASSPPGSAHWSSRPSGRNHRSRPRPWLRRARSRSRSSPTRRPCRHARRAASRSRGSGSRHCSWPRPRRAASCLPRRTARLP